MTYSEEQQKIAKILLEGPKTLDQLREASGLDAKQLNEELKGLLKLKVVERKEDEYKLIDLVEKAVRGETGPIEGVFQSNLIIEATSKDKESVEKQLGILEDKIKKERVKIDFFEKKDVNENDGYFNAFIELTISVDSLLDLVMFIISYGPSSVEFVKPKKVELNQNEVQEILHQISSAVYYYTSLIIQLKYADLYKEKQKKPYKSTTGYLINNRQWMNCQLISLVNFLKKMR